MKYIHAIIPLVKIMEVFLFSLYYTVPEVGLEPTTLRSPVPKRVSVRGQSCTKAVLV